MMNRDRRSYKRSRKRRPAWHQPRKVEHYWKLYKKDTYVAPRTSGLPGWLLPLFVLILIIALIFWVAPMAVSRLQGLWPGQTRPESTEQVNLYTDSTWAVQKPVADLFETPDLKARRLAQALYNEPVFVRQEQAAFGYVSVRLSDGTSGYMLVDDLVDDRISLEPAGYPYKAVVVNSIKRIMSHASKGSLLAEVMMGTSLYIDYRGAGVSRVVLPGGEEGWISDDGVVIIPAQSQIEQPFAAREAFCNSAMVFLRATVLENGLSVNGISLPGLVHVAGAVNGLILPRTLSGLQNAGQPVQLARSEETGLVLLESLVQGDLLFLAGREDGSVTSLALYLAEGQILYARPAQTSIRLISLEDNEDLWRGLVAARRLFPD